MSIVNEEDRESLKVLLRVFHFIIKNKKKEKETLKVRRNYFVVNQTFNF